MTPHEIRSELLSLRPDEGRIMHGLIIECRMFTDDKVRFIIEDECFNLDTAVIEVSNHS